MQPIEVTDVQLAFPANVSQLMPAYEQIPVEFRRGESEWVDWQSQWFYHGIKKLPTPKPGVDLDKAIRHLRCIQGSFEPKHEHKQAAVAYLASLWFEQP